MGYNICDPYRFHKASFKFIIDWNFFWNYEQYLFQVYEIFSTFCNNRDLIVIDYWVNFIFRIVSLQFIWDNKFIDMRNFDGSLHMVQFISSRKNNFKRDFFNSGISCRVFDIFLYWSMHIHLCSSSRWNRGPK